MFVSLVLEVALALVAVYAGVGLASSVLAEWLATWLRWRPKFLDSGIKALLGNAQGADGQPLAESFGEAPLVRSLQQGSRRGASGPGSSYLPAWAFTETV